MSSTSIDRFVKRLDSYERAFARLDELAAVFKKEAAATLFPFEESGLDADIAREALIKRFEFTQELSWNLLRDYLLYQGEMDVAASRDTYRRSLRYGLIDDGEWMNMINDRNLSAHDYNDSKSREICERIINTYHPLLLRLRDDMRRRKDEILKG